MTTGKRCPDAFPAHRPSPRRRVPWRTLARRAVCVALLCAALTGCSLIGGPRARGQHDYPRINEPLTRRKEKKSFGSWFFKRTDEPSDSITDFISQPRLGM